MISEILMGLLISLVYDSLKQGTKLGYRHFTNKLKNQNTKIPYEEIDRLYHLYSSLIDKLENKIDAKFSELESLIYSIKTELMQELKTEKYHININLNDIDDKLLEKIILKYLDDVGSQNNDRNFKFHYEKANGLFDIKNYDGAIKQYQEAGKYITDKSVEHIVLWQIFTCYLKIKNYYVSLYALNEKIVDIAEILNNCDNSISWAANLLKKITRINYSLAYDILNNHLNGTAKYEQYRKFAISQYGYDTGLKAIALAKNYIDTTDMQKIYDDLYCIA